MTEEIRPRKYSKSDRTHEENQERAYIAASRRSDRSLEARMESARRASEIHRRRTGRGFKITEEAVLNEEMYEEEDPDFGLRLRRLHAALAADTSWKNRQWLQSYSQTAGYEASPTSADSPSTPQFPTYSNHALPFFAYKPGSQPSNTPIRNVDTSELFTEPISPTTPTAMYADQANLAQIPAQYDPRAVQAGQRHQFFDPSFSFGNRSMDGPQQTQFQHLAQQLRHGSSSADSAMGSSISTAYSSASSFSNSDRSSSSVSPNPYTSSGWMSMVADADPPASTPQSPLPSPRPTMIQSPADQMPFLMQQHLSPRQTYHGYDIPWNGEPLKTRPHKGFDAEEVFAPRDAAGDEYADLVYEDWLVT